MTKYRRRVFTDEHLTAIEPILSDVCADFGATLTEFNGEDDHVHLLVEYPPTVQRSKLANSLESVSSRRLRQQFQIALTPQPSVVAVLLRGIVRGCTFVNHPAVRRAATPPRLERIGYPGPEGPD